MAVKTAVVRQIQGVTFAAKAGSNHWVAMDGPAEFGGSDAATRPKELLLMALGGCTGADVASILAKKRLAVASFEIKLTATESEEHPKVFTDIHIEYIVTGKNVPPADVERAINLSTEKYCGVQAMLRPAVKITHSFQVLEG